MEAFCTDKGGIGLFNRVKKRPRYVYYKATSVMDDYTLEEFKNQKTSKREKALDPATVTASTATPESTFNVNLTWDINLNFYGLKGLFK